MVEWTRAKILLLIKHYKNIPMLWDPDNPDYYKRGLKLEAWGQVANQMGISWRDCKLKMISVLASLRREKLKEKRSIASGKGKLYKSSWFAFEALSFLNNREFGLTQKLSKFDKTSESGELSTEALGETLSDTASETSDSPNKKLKLREISDPIETLECHRQSHFSEVTGKRQTTTQLTRQATAELKLDTIAQQNLQPLLRPSQQPILHPTSTVHLSELRFFCNFLLEKMKNYNKQMINSVQQEIMKIIFRADDECFNNIQSEMPTATSSTGNYLNQSDDYDNLRFNDNIEDEIDIKDFEL